MQQDLYFDGVSIFNKTLEICAEDANYPAYSAREKMLAFVFTFLQSLKEDEQQYAPFFKQRLPLFENKALAELKHSFFDYSDTLILEGTNSGEIQARPFIANYYKQALWNAFTSILYFWAKDNSEHKEHTDVLVEKTIHFTFDLLAPNAIDSGIDLLQNFIKLRK